MNMNVNNASSEMTEYEYTPDGIEYCTDADEHEDNALPSACSGKKENRGYTCNAEVFKNTNANLVDIGSNSDLTKHTQNTQNDKYYATHDENYANKTIKPEIGDDDHRHMYIQEFSCTSNIGVETNLSRRKPNRMKDVFKRYWTNTENEHGYNAVNSSIGFRTIENLAMKLATVKDGIKYSEATNSETNNTVKANYKTSSIMSNPIQFEAENVQDNLDNDKNNCFNKILREIYEKSLLRDRHLKDHRKQSYSNWYMSETNISVRRSENLIATKDGGTSANEQIKTEPHEFTSADDDECDTSFSAYDTNENSFTGQDTQFISKEKYEYFNRNVDLFMSRETPNPKRRKKHEYEDVIQNQDNLSTKIDTKGESSENTPEDQDEYTRKGYAKYFQCELCNRKFSQVGHLNRHMRIHTGDKPFKCSVCGKEFSQSSDKCRHERTHTSFRPYQCFICDKEFNQSGHLQRHLGTHAAHIIYKNGEFDKELTRKKYMEDKAAAADKTKKCPLCEKTFIKKYLLDRHVRSHTGETPYKCEECGKEFTRKDRLTTHARIHSGERPYTCKECGRGFNQGSHLRTHIRIHTGEKPYKCGICGRGFAQSHDKKKHERVHTGERPYVCPLCGKDFNDNSQLWRHARTHDDAEQEEGTSFKCHVCNVEYSCTSQLLQHIKIHMVEQKAHQGPGLEDSRKILQMEDFRITAGLEDSRKHLQMEDVRMAAEALVKETLVSENGGIIDTHETHTMENHNAIPNFGESNEFYN